MFSFRFRARMVAALLVPALTAGVPGATAAQGKPALNQGPMIHFDERAWDFGVIPQRTEVTHSFRFANAGTAPLRIFQVDTDCGCTAALSADSTLAPGRASSIEVKFSSGNFEGRQQKIVMVRTNDPAEPRIDLVVTAEVKPYVQVEKSEFEFGEVRRGETPVLTTLLTCDTDPAFRVAPPEDGKRIVTWKVTPISSENAKAFQLEARMRPDAPYGAFYERIEVPVTHRAIPYARVFLRGYVYSYFLPVFPGEKTRLEIPSLKAGRTTTRTVRITSDGSKPYRITRVSHAPPFLKTDLKEEGEGYLLTVTANGQEGPPRKFEEMIVLATTDPLQPDLNLPVRGRFVR